MYFRYWLFPQIERCFINIPRCSCIVFSGAYFRSLMLWAMKSLKEKCKLFSVGCFGCCNKPTLVTAVDEPSKGLRIQGRTVKKPSILEDFWSSSTCEMDNNVVQSRSLSSISISNQPLDPSTGTSSANNPQEFVNHGLLLWNQTRQQWLANKKPQNRPQVREPSISWNASYESLLGTNKPFPQRVPLAEMVDFLVDVWEQEGLYD
ncbi:uncharacterized protein LOC18054674 isoform X2 [Citrus clementina]|uniref:uncharacterized protein LOC18054674 isoform X2 n=1 Tax=Citrus clementina TaxID=85681 RepID=UPI000CED1DE4|nr:uncharacterized protein LOC18054674 isoform X2 [Citrus x clementina]